MISTADLINLLNRIRGANVFALHGDVAGKEPTITAGTTGQYWRGDKSWQAMNKAAVGLSNVDNTSDAAKPVSSAQQTALNAKAASSHSHAVADTTGLQGALDAKLDITAAAELIRDTIATALVQGSNITITPDDPGDTITIAATGGSGGADPSYTPGSFTVADGTAKIMAKRLALAGSERAVVAGSGRLVIL